MRYATERQRQEWTDGNVPPLLRVIVESAAAYALTRGWEFTLTEVWRSAQEDARLEGHGVHPLWRAVDIRTRDVAPATVYAVTEAINHAWVYDPHRPRLVCAYGKPHGTGPHLHIQISSQTARTTFVTPLEIKET